MPGCPSGSPTAVSATAGCASSWARPLSSRPPPVYTQSLASIFDAARPMPFRHVRQVHRATLKGSATPVAVKVQRPNIPIQLELLLYVYQKVFDLPVYSIA
ncbi:hypothetical protein PtA15_8A524 [Puccinia triticina]|uniref:ABC1 atypical kinase-like domain-containing protein n=1 Tax=Puccinia triticina TaxID=208348 RepID=A0ABY7CQY4_9BASI|nr:uncharacterized protein PtA15_8A524 [Puccinia triticina]WAQ87619.1 hypothetical protein PtA15_8A524 [Puccinia triticina]WAR57475.1 hypothetical protein PtB15_8B524 [Puccinia triticina]